MSRNTTILVAGLGSIGQRHSRLISERSDVTLLVCDPIEAHHRQTDEKVHRPVDGRFNDYTQALAAKPDIVMICTPNSLHVPMGLQAIEAGCDVLVEKPISDSFEQANRLVAAADQAGRLLHVGYMLRFELGLRQMKQIVASGELGEIAGGRAMIGTYITLLNGKTPERQNSPYAIVVDYTHELDFIRWILGDVKEVMSMGAVRGNLDLKGKPNIIQTLMTLESGALVQVHMDFIQYPQRRLIEIYGDKGTLAYDAQTGDLRHYRFGAEHKWETLPLPLDFAQRWDNLYHDQLDALIRAHHDRSAPAVSGQDGIEALRVAHAIIRAAETGTKVKVADIR